MSGAAIITAGVSLTGAAVIIFIGSLIYRNTAGKKIRKRLDEEYNRS